MARKRKRKAVKASKEGVAAANEEAYQKCPHSFVFQRGHVGKNLSILVNDTRRVMQPYTASSLKVRRKNVLQDFINVAGPLNISHFLVFTKTDTSAYLRVLRLPRGPTLTFKISSYSLCRDIVSSLKRHNMERKQFQNHPLLIMNGFSGDGMHFKLMTTMFQNLFPSINVNKVKLTNIRRCVLLNYNSETDAIEFRQYNIKAVPVGVSKGVKKLIKARIPDMSKYQDVSDLLLRGGDLSESEAELDGPHNEVILPQAMAARGTMKSCKSAIRLTETGPRMTLELIKIEEGVCSGEVLHHSLVHKTDEEKKVLQQKRHKKRKLKEKRKQEQEDNIKKKEKRKKELKKKCLSGMKKPSEDFEEVGQDGNKTGRAKVDGASSEDDDISYYRKEVGEEPEPELFPSRSNKYSKKRRSNSAPNIPNKRSKMAEKSDKIQRKSQQKDQKKGQLKNKPRKKAANTLTEIDRIRRRKKIKQKKVTKRMGKKKHVGPTKAHARKR